MSANAAAADLYFVLAPQMSDRVLSCLGDPTDVAGLMGQASTSGGSLKFLIDNARTQDAGSARDAACFANDPNPDLQEGLGALEFCLRSTSTHFGGANPFVSPGVWDACHGTGPPRGLGCGRKPGEFAGEPPLCQFAAQ
jgi:hypothetical protein